MSFHSLRPKVANSRPSKEGLTLVIGAGIAGLAAATALHAAGGEVCVLEQSGGIGGLAQTDSVGEFLFDRAGHFLHLSNPEVERFIHSLHVPLRRIRRQAAVMLGHEAVPYPLQYNLWAVEAGSREAALEGLRVAQKTARHDSTSFESALHSSWGTALADLFFLPYQEKLWARPLNELPENCGGRYAIQVDLALAEQGYIGAVSYPGYNATFWYPDSGRLSDLIQAMAEPIQDRVMLNAQPERIDARSRCCWLADGRRIEYENLISTTPLPSLLDLLGEIRMPSGFLQSNSVANVRVGFRGRLRVPWHWAYLPNRDIPAYRVGFPPNVHDATAPPGFASLSLEYGMASPSDRRHCAEEIAQTTLNHMSRAGWIEVDELVLVQEHVLSPAYVACQSEGRSAIRAVRDRLRSARIHLAGRFGCWEYYSMEDALLSGVQAARDINPAAGLPTT
jgi:protoporphyrinogen oxidase